MSWQLLVGLSVLIYSGNTLLFRTLMKEEDSDPYAQTIAFYTIVGLFALIFSILRGGFQYHISLGQIPYFVIMTIFSAASSILCFTSLKCLQASEYTILLSSSRLWVVIGAFIFLRESFSILRVIGTIIIIFGIAFAELKNRNFIFNKGVLFVLGGAFCYAITELVSYFILRNYDANSFTVYSYLLPVIALLIVNFKSIRKLVFYARPKNAINLAAVSVFDVTATLLLFYAYQISRNASQIGPIMELKTILSVILAIIILRERDHITNKIGGAILVVAGVIFVLL
jgi:drug/metabolite transporter (DMT)-like permease